jgi:hypothetical protein
MWESTQLMSSGGIIGMIAAAGAEILVELKWQRQLPSARIAFLTTEVLFCRCDQ